MTTAKAQLGKPPCAQCGSYWPGCMELCDRLNDYRWQKRDETVAEVRRLARLLIEATQRLPTGTAKGGEGE